MGNINLHRDALGPDDIDTLRLIFDRFCETHQKLRSDADMEICANLIVRLYQGGERDHAVLASACEGALRQDSQSARDRNSMNSRNA